MICNLVNICIIIIAHVRFGFGKTSGNNTNNNANSNTNNNTNNNNNKFAIVAMGLHGAKNLV